MMIFPIGGEKPLMPSLVKAINSTELTPVGSVIFFSGAEDFVDYELWKTDGTVVGTVRISDINPGSMGSNPKYLTQVGNILYFRASSNGDFLSDELWKSDGTVAGTVLVDDIRPGSMGSNPSYLTALGNTLFFQANDGTSGGELWKTNPTGPGAQRVADIFPGDRGSNPKHLTAVGNTLFFSAGAADYELWKSDGTASGTVRVADINPYGSSNPKNLKQFGNTIFFTADDGFSGYELWKSDGTPSGTVRVADINPLGDSFPNNLTLVGNNLFFTADDGFSGTELWKSDGTSPGTMRVADLWGGNNSSNPRELTKVGNTLFFRAYVESSGYELWTSDGTSSGTCLVADITPGFVGSFPRDLTSVDNTLFFSSGFFFTGLNLWVLDLNETPIEDGDPKPRISLTVSPDRVVEDQDDYLVFTFTRTGSYSNSLTIQFTVGDESEMWRSASFNIDYAQTGADYFPAYPALNGFITFAANSATATLIVDPFEDSSIEEDELVTLKLVESSDYILDTSEPVRGLILSDDTHVSLSVSPSVISENGADLLTYSFYRSGPVSDSLEINFSVTGSAVLNQDYIQSGATRFSPISGSFTFAPGSNYGTITVTTISDDFPDPDETLILSLTESNEYSIDATADVVATINDDIDFSNPYLIGNFDSQGWAFGIDVIGSIVFLADYDSGLQIIDVTNSITPVYKANYPSLDSWEVEVNNSHAYIAGGNSGLKIVDITNLTEPQLTAQYQNNLAVVDLFLIDDYIYLASGNALLEIIDITDPAMPYLKGKSLDFTGFADGIYVAGNYAYIADYFNGLRIIDISDKENPRLIGTCHTPGNSRAVEVKEALIKTA